MASREAATIANVFYGHEDHGILTAWIRLDFEGYHQGFGGLALDETIGPDFKKSISEFFGRPFDALAGMKCFALWAFDEHNERIEGLEREDGRRFLMTEWRRKHYPNTKSPLEERMIRIESEIKFLQRRRQEELAKLASAECEYIDWSKR